MGKKYPVKQDLRCDLKYFPYDYAACTVCRSYQVSVTELGNWNNFKLG
jgi:hypothetical protein